MRCMGDLLGGGIFVCTSHKHFSTRSEGHQLAVPTQVEVAHALEVFLFDLFRRLVVDDFHMHFLGFLAHMMSIDLTHVAVANHAVVGHAQETHWVSLVACHGLDFLKVVDGGFVHVEATAVTLTQEHHFLIAGQVSWITVFANVGGQDGVSAFLGVVIHHVAGY